MSLLEHVQTLAADVDREDSPYGYTPSKGIALTFIILFGISTLTHTAQTIYFRMWWAFPTIILAGCLEILGWSGRFWSSISPSLSSPFMIQITATIIGPTPLVAANFLILGAIIRILGPAYSRLSPRAYSIVFVSCDIISLVIQGGGGGIASSASDRNDLKGAKLGSNVMLAGIVFQLVVITFYAILACEFLVRYTHNRPVATLFARKKRSDSLVTLSSPNPPRGVLDTKIKIMIFALVFNTLCLFIRSIYRTIELADGWNGRIILTEVYFNVLDGAMVVLAIYTLNFAHPGVLIGRKMGRNRSAVDAEKNDSALELGRS
ncbi:RTA1 like protein-domain-containing protein [Armillaria novae-zelandiae]|uniref:RTA1 like protein-domain-containing protein n=1 Tax=Armillaria novae-zelandiae TaxID=153914 RepID=A0AA39P4F4_9AGAR|nr:RTA1 like protein-domain-containing protein [Armillaria novae-zelandiae]